MFHYTVDSTKNLQDTIQSLEEQLKQEQFGVLWELNINEKLEAKGLELAEHYRILEVCNPKEAYRVLSENPLVSYFLPCKIVVYESGEKVKVGMPKPTALISMVESEELKGIAQDIENRLQSCINRSI
jgi:uncharacterized protein (DUF302 family)